MNWRYTNIQHKPRIDLGVSVNEYCVLDIYYQTQSSPIYSVDGWSENTYSQVSQFLGLSKGAVHKIVDRNVKRGLMEVNPANPKQKRTTEKWYSVAYERVQKVNEQKKAVQKVNAKVSKVNASVQKVNDIIGIKKSKEEIKERDAHTKNQSDLNSPNVETPQDSADAPLTGNEAPREYENFTMDAFYSDDPDAAFNDVYDRVLAFHRNNPGTGRRLCESAKIKMSQKEYSDLLKKWIRWNLTSEDFFQRPVRRLSRGKSSLRVWLGREKENNPKPHVNTRKVDASKMYC